MATNPIPRLKFDGRKLYEDAVMKGLDLDDLARKSGKSSRTVYRFISGDVQTPETATKLAAALGNRVSRYLIRAEGAVA